MTTPEHLQTNVQGHIPNMNFVTRCVGGLQQSHTELKERLIVLETMPSGQTRDHTHTHSGAKMYTSPAPSSSSTKTLCLSLAKYVVIRLTMPLSLGVQASNQGRNCAWPKTLADPSAGRGALSRPNAIPSPTLSSAREV